MSRNIVVESFIREETLAKMKQAEADYPATEHTNAGGWCKYCGCGNDVLGYKHLRSCLFQAAPPPEEKR